MNDVLVRFHDEDPAAEESMPALKMEVHEISQRRAA
jgi:hypothetical protein